ncbi:hypothetical protein J4731_10250 [Providencia rettgeri]|nr:hypothetical protein [Providencia rettgeri]
MNGHSMDEWGFLSALSVGRMQLFELSNIEEQSQRLIGNWRLERRINQNDSSRERYLVTH